MANTSFYAKQIPGTNLELCYAIGWVEQGYCSLFTRNKDTSAQVHDFGVLTHEEAGKIWTLITDKKSLDQQYELIDEGV
jgi:hypothetical protein